MVDEQIETLIIKPINIPKFSGLSGYDKTKTTFGPEMDSKGNYKTGLTSKDEEYYEKELGLKPGTLNKRSSWWGDNIVISLNNSKYTFVEVNGVMGELKKKVILESSKVANSQAELKNKPFAAFFIYDEEAAAEAESSTIEEKADAYEIFSAMSPEKKRGLLKVILFEGKSAKRGIDEMSDKLVKTYLAKELEQDPKRFMNYAEDKVLEYKVLLSDAVEKSIIKKNKHYYSYGDEAIGNNTDEAIGFLMNPKNSTLKLSIETKIKEKSKNK